MEKRFQAALLAGAALAGSAGAAPVQDPDLEGEHAAAVRAIYGYDGWTRGAVRDGIPLAALELAGFEGGPLRAGGGHLSRSFARGDAPEGPGFVVEARVADDAQGAHAELLEWLAGLSGTRRMPSLAELGIPAGDAGFAGPSGSGPRALAWLAFARGNVAVRLVALDPRDAPAPDLGSLATRIDEAILARPALPAGAPPARPAIGALAADPPSVAAGEAVVLEVGVTDPANGEPVLVWTVGGPGQGYVERGRDGILRFHSTAPGAVELGLEAVGSTGTSSTRTVAIEVAESR